MIENQPATRLARRARPTGRVAGAFALLALISTLQLPALAFAQGMEAANAGKPPERPNIVLIISDDQGYGDFGFMGSKVAKTPNIDRLAREGSYFPVAYNTGSVCKPSLNTLLTGLEPKQWQQLETWAERRGAGGVSALRQVETLPRVLGRRGYASFQAGKLWEGSSEAAGFSDGLRPAGLDMDRPLDRAGGEASLAIGRTTMEPITNFIDAHQNAPFFVWFAPMLPHVPHDAPKRYEDRYRETDLSATERAYFANVSRLDDAVGELVGHLTKRGLRERTLIVLLADNGWQSRRHDPDPVLGGERGKASMYELGWRTPLVFDWPGVIRADGRIPRLVSTLDVVPTLLDYAGIAPPPGLLGRSLRPLLEGEAAPQRAALYGSDWGNRPRETADAATEPEVELAPAFFARTERWHYVWFSGDGRDLLFDVLADPAEDRDVAADHPEVVERLRGEIEAWREGVEKTVFQPRKFRVRKRGK